MEQLVYSDFSVESGDSNKNNLRLSYPGPMAVLIMSSSNDEGLQARQILAKLKIEGLGKACIDIYTGNNRNIIRMSQATITPIRRVPMLFLFIDGKIRGNYTKELSLQSVTAWFRDKYSKFASHARGTDPRARRAEGIATINAEEPMMSNRKRQNADRFSISRNQDDIMDGERGIGAPTGLNAAWRIDNAS